MQARMSNPAQLVPDAMPALLALGKATKKGGVPFAKAEHAVPAADMRISA